MSTHVATPVTAGPPLIAPLGAYALLAVAAAVTYPGPGPSVGPAQALAVLSGAPTSAAVSAVLLIASAAPFAVFVAAVTHRLWALGARVAGPVIGLAGGLLAAGSLAASGLAAWTASSAASWGDATAAWTASALSFASGGVGFALGSALLLAGVAVPAGLLGLLPRPMAVAGVVLAVAGALAPLGFLTPVLFGLLPIVRFGGLIWFVAAALLLPRTATAVRPAGFGSA